MTYVLATVDKNNCTYRWWDNYYDMCCIICSDRSDMRNLTTIYEAELKKCNATQSYGEQFIIFETEEDAVAFKLKFS